jgi:hypothetical protein
MFIVARIDGPGALIAKGLVEKAITAESSLHAKSGTGYSDMQGTRSPEEWQHKIDYEIKAAAELSTVRGFETFLHVQRTAYARHYGARLAVLLRPCGEKRASQQRWGALPAQSFPSRPRRRERAAAARRSQRSGHGAADHAERRFRDQLHPV